jgi:hypothetical protein
MTRLCVSAKQVDLLWRPALSQSGGINTQRLTAQVSQDLVNDQRVFDASDNFYAAAADITYFDVDIEHRLQALLPAHRFPALDRPGCFWPGRFGLITSATPAWRLTPAA